MKEYIAGCQGMWWHFFHRPPYGLCFRKKEGGRFGEFEILLKEAAEDFCVLSLGTMIHIVCQDQSGAILHLVYNGEKWEKLTLLASREGKPSPKHFSLIPVGNYLNLYYVLAYKEKLMLVHQLLGSPDTEPMVVDYITPSAQPFSVSAHSSTDLTVCYQNAQGVCGSRTFRWSQKSYSPFAHVAPGIPVFSPSMRIEEDDVCHFAALTRLESIQNLVYFRREPDGSYTEPVTIYLDCGESPQAVFFRQDKKLYLEWLDGGSVMASYSEDDGTKWKKPVKYMRNAATEVVLYYLCREGKSVPYYGFSDNGAINFYGAPSLLGSPPPEAPAPKYRPRGHEAADFARQFGYRRPPEEESVPAVEYVSAQEFHKELGELRQALATQSDIVLELLQRVRQISEWQEKNAASSIEEESGAKKSEPETVSSAAPAPKPAAKPPEVKSKESAKEPAKEPIKVVVTAN